MSKCVTAVATAGNGGNPWLLWLDHGAPAPIAMVPAEAEAALATKHARLRRGMARFLREGSVEAWLAVARVREDEQSIASLLGTLAAHRSRVAQRQIEVLLAQWERRLGWFVRRLCGKDAAKPLRKAAREAGKAGRATLAYELRDYLSYAAPRGDFDLAQRIKVLSDATRKQDEAAARYWARNGIRLTRWPWKRNRLVMREAAMCARAAGYARGWLVMPKSNVDIWLLQHCGDEALRRDILAQRAGVCTTTWADIDRMRSMQHKRAQLFGCKDSSELGAMDAVFMKPRRIERFLGTTAAMIDGRLRRGIPGARAYTREQWIDVRRTLGRNDGLDDDTAFPWRQSSLRIIDELMGVGGWHRVGGPVASGKGARELLHMAFSNAAGRRAELIFAPFDPAPGAASTLGGQATLVRERRLEQPGMPQVIILQTMLNHRAQRYLDLEAIEVLCHEIGHTLHYLALPGEATNESSLLVSDYDELPAMVLQNYWRDPDTLNRWSQGKRRRRAYWKRRMRPSGLEALVSLYTVGQPYLDILMRRRPGEKALDLCEQVREKHPSMLALSDSDLRVAYSMVDDMEVSHPLGMALAARVCPVPDDGVSSSALVAERFCSLVERVLARGVRPRSFLRNWSLFMGERYSVSVQRGMAAWARQSTAGVRRAARA